MKYPFLLAGLLLCLSSFGQRREKLKKHNFNSAKFKLYDVELKKKWFDSVRVGAAEDIVFIDARADKNKMGFIRTGDNNEFYNIGFSEETGLL